MKTVGSVVVAIAAVIAGLALAIVATTTLKGGNDAAFAATPSSMALTDIPANVLGLYQRAAQQCPGLSWAVLAGVGQVETDHGRNTAISSAGAQGPMQFEPATFAAYAVDGDGDGHVDINDQADAIFTAAHLLCVDGAGDPTHLRGALWQYNHSDSYVNSVLLWAGIYVTQTGAAPLPPDVGAVVNNPRITLTPDARADLLSGKVDGRIDQALTKAAETHTIAVSVIITGHDEFVHGTSRVSDHFEGRAVDIAKVDGQNVDESSVPAKALWGEIHFWPAPIHPYQVGAPWVDDTPQELLGGGQSSPWVPGMPVGGTYWFTDGDHKNHIHIGFYAAA